MYEHPLNIRHSAELLLTEKVGIEHMPCQDQAFTTYLYAHRPDVAIFLTSRHLSTPAESEHELPQFFDALDIPPQRYLSACISEFLVTLGQFRVLSRSRTSFSLQKGILGLNTSFSASECVSVRSAFRPKSPLNRTLLPSRQLAKSGSINANTNAAYIYEQETMRLASLFYLHATLWAHRNDPDHTDAYMAHVVSQTVQNNIDSSCNVETLSWILLWICLSDESETLKQRLSRTRLVLRLMRVARKLGSKSWRM
jgi:hypothetical protein